jgi:hypothetical protein
MHTQNTLHLSNAQVDLIEEVLSNSDYDASNENLVDVLVSNGVLRYPAEKCVEMRSLYLTNIFVGENTPLKNGCLTGFKAQSKVA